MMNKMKSVFFGASRDSFFLIFVKLVTTILGMVVTRFLAETLSITDYGTYSQIMLLVSTISSLTVLGMADGANYFFYNCGEKKERGRYISTIFSLQYLVSIVCAVLLLACTIPITRYFGNDQLKKLLIFAAILPVLQNMIAVLQVLFISIGKAKLIAIRNLVFSIARLILFSVACHILNSMVAVLVFTVMLDLAQIVYFRLVLHKNNCIIDLRKTDLHLAKRIISYCVPMAIFLMLSTLTRDCDRYVISAFTDTNTLAIYTNAAKMLPFDIIMSSFCTVLLPYLTHYIANEQFDKASDLYKQFLELSYLSTTIMAGAAITAAPMLIQLLYSEKYLSGLPVFILYITVDIFRLTNITLVLSAKGKTKILMLISGGCLLVNVLLNIALFKLMGIAGPAVSTLLVTIASGILILKFSASELHCYLKNLFDFRYLLLFVLETVACIAAFGALSYFLSQMMLYYIVRLLIVGGGFGLTMLLLNIHRIMSCMKTIGTYKLDQ